MNVLKWTLWVNWGSHAPTRWTSSCPGWKMDVYTFTILMLWTELSIRKPGTPKKHDKPLLEKNFAFCSGGPCFNSHRWLRVCDPGFTANGRVVLSTAASHWWTGADAWMGRRLPALGATKMNMDKMALSQTCRGCKRCSVPKWIKGAERCDLQSCGHNL